MQLTTTELDWLIKRLCPDADADALQRIETRVQALNSTVGDMSLDLNTLANTIGAIGAQETNEMSQLDDLKGALDATKQAIADAQARVNAKLDALAAANTQPDLAPLIQEAKDEAASLGQIVPADVTPAAAPADPGTPTGGTTVTGGTTATDTTTPPADQAAPTGDQTPVPVDQAPVPVSGDGTTGSAGGPAA